MNSNEKIIDILKIPYAISWGTTSKNLVRFLSIQTR